MIDIRIAVGAQNHRKIKKLRARLGDAAWLYLTTLWMYAAEYRPRGVLSDMSIEDIELASDWPGEPGKFVSALIDTKLLDIKNDTYLIHDYTEHQPYVASAPKRKQAAKKAARARWERKYGSMRGASKGNADFKKGNAPFPDPFPDPFPVPDPVPDPKNKDSSPRPKKPDAESDRFDEFYKAYPRKVGKTPARKAWNKIKPSERDAIFTALESQIKARHLRTDEPDYIPHPATWLNQRRWEDEIKTAGQRASPMSITTVTRLMTCKTCGKEYDKNRISTCPRCAGIES